MYILDLCVEERLKVANVEVTEHLINYGPHIQSRRGKGLLGKTVVGRKRKRKISGIILEITWIGFCSYLI